MSKPKSSFPELLEGVEFQAMSQMFNSEQSGKIIGLFLDYLQGQGLDPKDTVFAFDSDGTITFHTWDKETKVVKDGLKFSNIPFFKALCQEAVKRGFGVVIDSMQYKDPELANIRSRKDRIGLSQIYGDEVEIIGRELTNEKGIDKGEALKEVFKTQKHVVAFDDDGSNVDNIDKKVTRKGDYFSQFSSNKVVSLCGYKEGKSSKMLLPVMKFWKQSEEQIGEDKKKGKPFGVCPESMLLFLIDQGVKIPKDILKKNSQEQLEKTLASSLNISGDREIVKARQYEVICLLENKGHKIPKEYLEKEGVKDVKELEKKIFLKGRFSLK